MNAGHSGRNSGSEMTSSAVRDFGQLALWMAASLAGMVTAMLVARGPYFRRLGRSVGLRPAASHRRRRDRRRHNDGRSLGYGRPTRTESLPMLAEAIVGNTRENVAAVFGPPRGAVVCGTVGAAGDASRNETWYYPLEREQNLAMAIEFDGDAARHVEFLSAPLMAA
jgi:hypothetical protein